MFDWKALSAQSGRVQTVPLLWSEICFVIIIFIYYTANLRLFI